MTSALHDIAIAGGLAGAKTAIEALKVPSSAFVEARGLMGVLRSVVLSFSDIPGWQPMGPLPQVQHRDETLPFHVF